MKAVLIFVVSLIFIAACSTKNEPAKRQAVNNLSPTPKIEKAVYESNLNEKASQFEPVPPSTFDRFYRVFGDDITISKHHISLSKKQITSIKQKSDLANLSDAVLKDIYADLVSGEIHPLFIFRKNGEAKEKQIAVVNEVSVDNLEIQIIYSSKDNQPFIKEIRSEFLPEEFLDQFAEKDKTSKIKLGEDISAKPLNADQAKKLTDAIRADFWTMQTIYGS